MRRSVIFRACDYGDPAEVAERNELNRMGCSLCVAAEEILTRTLCKDPRNDKQKGVPHIGHRCRWFKEKGE